MPRVAIEVGLAGAAPRRLVFDKTDVVVGRSPQADVVLDSDQVSRQHCRLAFADGHWRLSDTNSANGVYLDRGGRGAPFLARHDLVVTGDHLYVGRYRLKLVLEDGSGEAAASAGSPRADQDDEAIMYEAQESTRSVRRLDLRREVGAWLDQGTLPPDPPSSDAPALKAPPDSPSKD